MAVFNYAQVNLGSPELRFALRALIAEVAKIRTAYALLVAKLDADDGVTDIDYAATTSPAANEFLP